MRHISTLVVLLLGTLLYSNEGLAQGPFCSAASEFCAENGLSFPAGTNTGVAEPGNDYGCLSTFPNPAWFYMSTTAAGTATINLTSSAGVDIDFALWGPFTSLADALSNCGSLSSPVSCSYAPTPNETVVLNSGGPGEFFILLITNFSNQPTNVAGSTSSTILGCNICIAEGGVLEPDNQVGCVSTLDDITVDFQGTNPDPVSFGYTMVVTTPAGVITNEYFQTSLSPAFLGPGTFNVCGIGYEFGGGAPGSFIGLNVNTLRTDLMAQPPPWCGDVSDNCVTITISPDPIPAFLTDSVCIGAQAPNCPFIDGNYVCNPGSVSFITQTAFGCDSLTTVLVLPRNSIFANDSLRLCPGQPYEYDGDEYFAPGIVSINIPAGPGGGCDTTLFLELQLDPLIALITPPVFTLDCNTNSIILSSVGSSSGTNVTYNWSGPNGDLGSGTTITVTEAGTYELEVTRTDPRTGQTCSLTASALILAAPPEIGLPAITGPIELCEDVPGTFSANYAGPYGPYSYEWTVTGAGASTTFQAGNPLVVSWSQPGVVQVCVTAEGTCGPTLPICESILINVSEVADAGPDQTVCGLSTSLNGSPAGGTWTALTGPSGTGAVANPSNSSTTVSAPSGGTYEFSYSLVGNCSADDIVSITFGDPLSLGQIDETCLSGTQQYTVSIELIGGTPPFIVSGLPGTVAGSTFISNPVNSGVSYNVTFLDSNGCTATATGVLSCACTTDAGQMSQTPLSVCVPANIQSTLVSGEVLDNDDVGVYVLHTAPGASLGTVLGSNTTGNFAFSGGVLPNVLYYVSYVVGSDNGSGQPDPTDPCYDVSQGQPVTWIQPDVADAGTDQSLCGLSTTLNATSTPGRWTFPVGTVVSDATDPNSTFSATTYGVYQLTWTTGLTPCTDADQVEISLNADPVATHTTACNATATMYTLTITASGGQSPYTVNGGIAVSGSGSVFTTTLPAGTTYTFTIVDANGCESVQYSGSPNCNCLTDAGQMPTATVDVCVPDDLQSGAVIGENLDPNDVGVYVLHDTPGNTLGTVFQINATGLFAYTPPLVANTTYYVSYVAGNDNGSGQPDPSDPCYEVSTGQPVRWVQPEIADAGPDQSICGLSTTLAALGAQGVWSSVDPVTFTSASNSSATVSSSTFGTYTLVWTTGVGACTDSDTVLVSFNGDPNANDNFSCTAGSTTYTLTISASGGQAPYSVNAAFAVTGAGPVFTTVLPVGTTYSYSIIDANGCESIVYTGTPDCNCLSDAGSMPPSILTVCAPDDLQAGQVSGELLDQDDIGVYVLHDLPGNTLGTVFQTSPTGLFMFAAPLQANVSYYVSFVVGNDVAGAPDPSDPCYVVSSGQEVIWEAPEVAIAGADQTVCGLQAILSASGAPGQWTGPSTVTFSDATSATSTVSSSVSGTVTLTWTTGQLGCTYDDSVDITFSAGPTATATASCQPGAANYDLTITVSGGVSPYNINGLTATGGGTVFTSSIPSGTGYSFTVIDGDGCESIAVSGIRDCACETVVPSMGAGATACVGEMISLATATGGTNDGNDIDEYILYQGGPSSVSQVLATAVQPTFLYDPAYLPGVTYYVAVQRGNPNGQGGVDQADNCFDRSVGVPVVWNALPTISFTDAIACEGEVAEVAFTYTGLLPATLSYEFQGVLGQYNVTSNTGTLPFDMSGQLTVISLQELAGCSNSALTTSAIITIQTLTPPELTGDQSLCNTGASGGATSVMLSALLVSGSGGTWTSPDAPGAIQSGAFNALGLTPGQYNLTYSVPATGSCPSTSATLMITVRDCACPNLTLLSPGVLCNFDARISLASLLEEPQGGIWSIVRTPAGSLPAQLANGFFDGTGADAGTYRLLFTLTSGNVSGCPDTSSVAIRLAREPLAGSSIGDIVVCESDAGVIDLASQLVGQDSGGNWSNISGSIQPQGSIIDLSNFSPGLYTFQYFVAAPTPCSPVSADVLVEIQASPTAEAGEDVVLTCTVREAELGTPAVAGLTYSWSAVGASSVLSTDALFLTQTSGLFTLTVTDNLSGCSSVDMVEVALTNDVPIVDVELQPISCAGEQDAAVIIRNISGGAAPYSITLNGQPVLGSQAFSGLGSGSYSVGVSDASGCTADPLSFEITEPEQVNVDINPFISGSSSEIVFSDTILLEAVVSGGSGASVRWSPSQYVACDTCAVTFGIPPASLTYSIRVTTPEGCSDEDIFQVIVRKERDLYFPTGFSPNGDGVNDVFYPRAEEGMVSRIASMIILDRWGEELFRRGQFQPNDPTQGWDGTFYDEPLNPQVCVYLCEVEFSDGTKELFKGDISIIR